MSEKTDDSGLVGGESVKDEGSSCDSGEEESVSSRSDDASLEFENQPEDTTEDDLRLRGSMLCSELKFPEFE